MGTLTQSGPSPNQGYRIFRYHSCQVTLNERAKTFFNNVQFPTDIVLIVVLWRVRYKLSLRDLVEIFAVWGYAYSHETVCDWEAHYAPPLTTQLRANRHGQAGKSWYVDETGEGILVLCVSRHRTRW